MPSVHGSAPSMLGVREIDLGASHVVEGDELVFTPQSLTRFTLGRCCLLVCGVVMSSRTPSVAFECGNLGSFSLGSSALWGPHPITRPYGRYLLSIDVPSGLSVLELGSGCGVAGLAVAAFLSPSSIFLTDGNEGTIKNLSHNVIALQSSLTAIPVVERFTWAVDPCPGGQKFDLVIGSDLLYSKEGASQLAVAIDECLSRGGRAILVLPAYRSDESKTRAAFKRIMVEKRFFLTETAVAFPTDVKIADKYLCHDGKFEVLECRRVTGGI